MTTPEDARLASLMNWLGGLDWTAGVDPVPASADASFRRYFRLSTSRGSYIAMDAPPEQEDCTPFVRIAGHLEAMGLNSPRVVAGDTGNGFLLMTDLGCTHYLEHVERHPGDAQRLYDAAVRALLVLQERGAAFQSSLPSYDADLLLGELALFHDWLCETHLGLTFGRRDEAEWRASCERLVTNALEQPQVFVHRDYHSRNLMVTGDSSPGILDFQDAVEGPLTYDLVSLLRDCYLRLPEPFVSRQVERFHALSRAAALHSMTEAEFRQHFDLMGVQRHLKAAGIFARLLHRDGKPGYLGDVPRTLGYVVDLGSRYPELGFLVRWIGERVLPGLGPPR
jgi:hypothetical protein